MKDIKVFEILVYCTIVLFAVALIFKPAGEAVGDFYEKTRCGFAGGRLEKIGVLRFCVSENPKVKARSYWHEEIQGK